LFLDNTFGDPKFNFPTQKYCLGVIKEIINDNIDATFWISTESLGKEELMIDLAETYST
jgi:hypothetical protein